MLIRLCGHYIENPGSIDKLIAIKGLPEEWFFRNVSKKIEGELVEGKELVAPWEPDVEDNIPASIRHLCEPVEIVKIFPPIEKGRESVVDRKTISGVRFNFMSNPGQELWEKIERYLERMTPRDQKVPKPVIVAPDHKSGFNPQEARKNIRGSLEFRTCEIPSVDLRIIPSDTVTAAAVATAGPIVVVSVPQPKMEQPKVAESKVEETSFSCDKCPKVFNKKQALRMHTMKMHKTAKEPVGV